MVLLVALLALRSQKIAIISSTFKRINNNLILRDYKECPYDGKTGTKVADRIEQIQCFNFSLTSSHYSNINFAFSVTNIRTSYDGGVVNLNGITNATIYNNTFLNIKTGNSGGAVYFENVGNSTIIKNSFEKMKAKNGGSLYFKGSKNITILDNDFSNSLAERSYMTGGSGGTIYLENTIGCCMSIQNCKFIKSESKLQLGGAIYCDGASKIEMTGIKFVDCSSYTGGVLYFSGITTKIDVSGTFENTRCSSEGGAIYITSSSKIYIQNTSFKNSSITEAIEEGSTERNGGTIYIDSNSDVFIEDCIFNISNCTYGNGGACYLHGLANIQLSKTKFIECTSQENGGAIYLYDSKIIKMIGNTFRGCLTTNISTVDFMNGGGALNILLANSEILENNTFDDCHSFHFGGAISLDRSSELTLKGNNFTNCFVENDKGGALNIVKQTGLKFEKNSFVRCNAQSYGAAIYLFSITKGLESTWINGDQFIECSTSSFGGAVSLYTVDTIILFGITCKNCNSSQGGFIYTYDLSQGIEIINSSFSDCLSENNGGAVSIDQKKFGSVYPLTVTGCNFTRCVSKIGNGGALYIDRNINTIVLESTHFLSCKAKKFGGAIYYNYDFWNNRDIVQINTSHNTFEDCESETYGTFTIDSRNVDAGNFKYDTYINCRATGTPGNGGAFMADVKDFLNFVFFKCQFIRCSSTTSFGALGIKLGNSINNNPITLRGCAFEGCSSSDAACFGTLLTKPESVTLTIEGTKKTETTFRSLTKGNYAIKSDASVTKFKNITFESVEIGAFNGNSKSLDLVSCYFNKCKSARSIISYPVLNGLKMDNITFSQCENCLNIICSGLSTISSLTIKDSLMKSVSNLQSNTSLIYDLVLINNKEKINVIIGNSLRIERGVFDGDEEIVSITGNNLASSLFYANSLILTNSLMFSVDKIQSTTIRACKVSYNVPGSTKEKCIIESTSSTKFEISSCEFSTSTITPIKFPTLVQNGILDKCQFSGNDSPVEVGGSVKVSNSEFSSHNQSFVITSENGIIKLDSNTNCFMNNNIYEVISQGHGRVTDLNDNNIYVFGINNNKCHNIQPTSVEHEKIITTPTKEPIAIVPSQSIAMPTKIPIPPKPTKSPLPPEPTKSPLPQEEKKTSSQPPQEKITRSLEPIVPKPTNTPVVATKQITQPVIEATSKPRVVLPTQSATIEKIITIAKTESKEEIQEPTQSIKKEIEEEPKPTATQKQEKIPPTEKKPQTENIPPVRTEQPQIIPKKSETPKIIPTSVENIKDTVVNSIKRTESLKSSALRNENEENKPIDEEANVADGAKSGNMVVIAGAAAGGVIVIIIVVIVIYVLACRKRNKTDTSSFNEMETEFVTGSSLDSTNFAPTDLKTSYTTQEMPTCSWTNPEVIESNEFNTNDDFGNVDDEESY